MTDILMVVPRYTPITRSVYYEFPLGMAYVSSSLKKAGYEVKVMNLNHGDSDIQQRLAGTLSELKPGVVMTGGLSAHHRQIRGLIEIARKSSPESKLVVGGGIVTASPEWMYHYLAPDFIVIGEGEVTSVELVDHLSSRDYASLGDVPGIGLAEDGHFRMTEPRAPIMDLDSLPYPDLETFGIEEYLSSQRPNDNLYLFIDDEPRFYPIISSRGCPYNCTFCYHPLGHKYRSRSVDNFIAEVQYVIDRYDVRSLAIFDELIAADRERLFEICRRISAMNRKLNWMCQLRVDGVDGDMLSSMKKAGCFLVSYGLESASATVLKSMNKHINTDQIERALRLTREAGIAVQGYFIFGDPAETAKTAEETLQFYRAHQDYHITLGLVRPYPGSVLWKREFQNCGLSEIEFLEKCTDDPPNMTRMTSPEWRNLRREIQTALLVNDHFGEFLHGHPDGSGEDAITIRCPHCGSVVEYRRCRPRILGVFKLVCRVCCQAMNMTPLVFGRVRRDYRRNRQAFDWMTTMQAPVYVIPCMNEGEFEAQREFLLRDLNIVGFIDSDLRKQACLYQGVAIRSSDPAVISELAASETGFLIPLTRWADKLFADLIFAGAEPSRICRLDTLYVGPGMEQLTTRLLAGESD